MTKRNVFSSFGARYLAFTRNRLFFSASIIGTKPSGYTFVRQISNMPLRGFSCLWRQIGRLLNIGYKNAMSQRYPTCYLFDGEDYGVRYAA